MDPSRKITKKFTKKFDSKVINRQYFHRKTGLQIQPCALRVLQNSQKRIANSLPELHALLYSLLTNKNVFGNKSSVLFDHRIVFA